MVYTPPIYPTEIPSEADLVFLYDDLDDYIAKYHNSLNKELRALMTAIGIMPQGSMSDLKTRLAVCFNDNGTLKQGVIMMDSVATEQIHFNGNVQSNSFTPFSTTVVKSANDKVMRININGRSTAPDNNDNITSITIILGSVTRVYDTYVNAAQKWFATGQPATFDNWNEWFDVSGETDGNLSVSIAFGRTGGGKREDSNMAVGIYKNKTY